MQWYVAKLVVALFGLGLITLGLSAFRLVIGYEIDGVRHQGGQSDFDISDAAKIVARYEKGTTAPVFYDPTDPQKSVLEWGPGGAFIGCTFTLLSLLAIALIAWVAAS